MANPHDKSNLAARCVTLTKDMRGKAGFQSFEELMTEIKHDYKEQKQVLDNQVLTTIRQKKNRMKAKECGIEYPQHAISNGLRKQAR